MSLRVGIDLDGTIADLSSAYLVAERSLLGDRTAVSSPARLDEPDEVARDEETIEQAAPEEALTAEAAIASARHEARARQMVWEAIRNTENFWEGLKPLEPGVVGELYEAAIQFGWETYFLTQRPRVAGRTVQQQTQLWLEREGFERPSVLTLSGGRGRAAATLELDYLLDDYPQNCLDVIAESRCRPLLILRTPSATSEAAAEQCGIRVMRSVAEAITFLQSPGSEERPGFVRRLFGRGGR
jgi:hypothetical protein